MILKAQKEEEINVFFNKRHSLLTYLYSVGFSLVLHQVTSKHNAHSHEHFYNIYEQWVCVHLESEQI